MIMQRKMQVPPWIDSLLTSDFFSVCASHKSTSRSECNMYCLDCKKDPFCFYCRSSGHEDHQVIQIRRSSYHDVVRMTDIQNLFDISGIQTYVINSARVIFLNERPQLKNNGVKGGSGSSSSLNACEICGRILLDPFHFCSLGCKLVTMKKNGDLGQFFTGEKKMRDAGRGEDSMEEEEEESRPLLNPHTKRRKGIPHRAPLAS